MRSAETSCARFSPNPQSVRPPSRPARTARTKQATSYWPDMQDVLLTHPCFNMGEQAAGQDRQSADTPLIGNKPRRTLRFADKALVGTGGKDAE